MKYFKTKRNESSIRLVTSDDKQIRYGLMGTVEDFIKANLFGRYEGPANKIVFSDSDGHCEFFDDVAKCKEYLHETYEVI